MNQVNLIGNLTRDPEQFKGKEIVVGFTIAVNNGEHADFIPIKCFKKTADNVMQYLKKGMPVGITGRITTGSYQKDDGSTQKTFEVIADRVDFLTKKEDKKSETTKYSDVKFSDNDLPF